MLNFDDSHKSIDGNIKEKKGTSLLKRIIAIGMLAVGLFTFSGCAKTIPCDIENEHAHFYVNSENIGRYISSEQSYLGFFSRLYRTDNYIEVNADDKAFVKFIDDNRLYSVEANQEAIDKVVYNHQPHLQYQYEDDDLVADVSYDEDGNASYSYHWETNYYWTNDPNHKWLTGKERVAVEIYHGYKLEKQDNGTIRVVKSPTSYTSMDALVAAGYDYIKDNFHEEIHSDDKNYVQEFKAQQAEQQANNEATLTEESGKTAGK